MHSVHSLTKSSDIHLKQDTGLANKRNSRSVIHRRWSEGTAARQLPGTTPALVAFGHHEYSTVWTHQHTSVCVLLLRSVFAGCMTHRVHRTYASRHMLTDAVVQERGPGMEEEALGA
eukprot:763676-Amphidinium_carterae.1